VPLLDWRTLSSICLCRELVAVERGNNRYCKSRNSNMFPRVSTGTLYVSTMSEHEITGETYRNNLKHVLILNVQASQVESIRIISMSITPIRHVRSR